MPEQASAAPSCEHYYAWVSPAGTRYSAHLCMSCHQPDPAWLTEMGDLRAAVEAAADEMEAWEWRAPVGPGNASYANGYENGRRSVAPDFRALLATPAPEAAREGDQWCQACAHLAGRPVDRRACGHPAPDLPTTVQADEWDRARSLYAPMTTGQADRDAGQVRLTSEEREALNVAVDEAETCTCHGTEYGVDHVYAAVERIIAARQSADTEATERVVRDLIRLIDYWETQAGVDRDMESKTLRGVVAHLKALVEREAR